MPYALLVKYKIFAGRYEDSTRGLNEHVVPIVKQSSGFIRGTWFGDDQAGHGLVLLDSEGQAREAATTVSPGPDDAIEIESATVYEVNAEA